jgi:hypothetical protein
MSRSILIKAIGGIEKVELKKRMDINLIQKYVGGHIESIADYYLKEEYHNYRFYVDEEGMMKDLPLNVHVNPFLREDRAMPFFGGPLGNCLVLKINRAGNTVKMTESEIKKFFDEKTRYEKEVEEESKDEKYFIVNKKRVRPTLENRKFKK